MRANNILLTGMSGVGKSTIGKLLALYLNWKFIDMDQWIEDQQGVRVNTIFDQAGEAHFRELEKNALVVFSQNSEQVIALGGGALYIAERVVDAKRAGWLVYVQASLESIAIRLKRSQDQRPLLRGLPPDKMREKIAEQLAARANFYAQSDCTVSSEGKRPEAVALEIRKWFGELKS